MWRSRAGEPGAPPKGRSQPDPVIYAGSEHAALSLRHRLEQRGIRARLLDDPNWFARLTSFGTYRFRVAVAHDDRERAEGVMEEWHSFHAPRAQALARRLQRVAVASLVPVSAWAVAGFAAPQTIPAPTLEWGALLWLLSLVTVAQLEHRRSDSP